MPHFQEALIGDGAMPYDPPPCNYEAQKHQPREDFALPIDNSVVGRVCRYCKSFYREEQTSSLMESVMELERRWRPNAAQYQSIADEIDQRATEYALRPTTPPGKETD